MRGSLLAAAVFGADQLCKYQIEKKPDGYKRELAGGRIILRKSHNTGAMRSFMQERPQAVTGVSAALLTALIVVWRWTAGRPGYQVLSAALALLAGGGASNVSDRLVRHRVVDYVSFRDKKGKPGRTVFNLADFSIFLGASALIFWNFHRRS